MSVHATAPPFSTLSKFPLATIRIGPDATTYHVHTALITHFSAYFERALRGPGSAEMSLNDVPTTIFDIFVDWLYAAKLPAKWPSTRAMMEAVVFGHVYLAPRFQAAVHNKLVDVLVAERKAVGYGHVAYMFEKLPADHALLELLVVLHCYYGAEAVDVDEEAEAHGKRFGEYWRRVKAKGFKTVDLLAGGMVEACEYHVHATEEERWECSAE